MLCIYFPPLIKKNRNCKKNLLMIKESILGTNIFSIRCYLFTFLCLTDKKPNCTKYGVLFPKLF